MVLVDTSVWVDFFAGKDLPHVERLERLIAEGEDLCICGIVLAEVLQGIRDDRQHRKTRQYLDDLLYLDLPKEVYLKAADIYRSLRSRGVTIRNTVDCLIAAACIQHGATLLHNDRDFGAIGGRFPLKILVGE
jgi:predicted nucleic acid-binding protein